MEYEFEGEIWRWAARQDAWYFVTLPLDVSDEISAIPLPPRGFGSVRVRASIGLTRWETSVFPDAKRAAYVLPLKKAVMRARGLAEGDTAAVRLEIL